MKLFKYVLIAGIAFLTACGGGAEGEKTTTTAPAEGGSAAPAASGDAVTLEITGDDVMKFDKAELRAKAGQKVTLKLIHSGKLAKEAMGHNVVILKAGVDIADFATKAIDAKDTDYVPAGEAANIIAHTRIIGGGETDEITFTAPAAGTYPFLCSFPGHYGFMKGEFIVE